MTHKNIGIEREAFITNSEGFVVPQIGNLLPVIFLSADSLGISRQNFTYELFAGQIEDRTIPTGDLDELLEMLTTNQSIVVNCATQLGLGIRYDEFVDVSEVSCFEVNPFCERHKQIWGSFCQQRKFSSSTVAGIHIHIECSFERAVDILNSCRDDVIRNLMELGNGSGGKRLVLYKETVGRGIVPPLFSDLNHLKQYINDAGGEKEVWDLVRYKPSTGTVEFRMFGTTDDYCKIKKYIQACLEICS